MEVWITLYLGPLKEQVGVHVLLELHHDVLPLDRVVPPERLVQDLLARAEGQERSETQNALKVAGGIDQDKVLALLGSLLGLKQSRNLQEKKGNKLY